MALILCIETGTDVCSVGIVKDGSLLSLRESDLGRDHAKKVAVFVDELLRENSIAPEDIDAVAVGKGPGSYTGLRIGVSFAKGLCYALSNPLIAVGSLEALTAVAREDYEAGIIDVEGWEEATLCPMVDARRMEVYAQLFDANGRALSDVKAEVVTADSFAEQRTKGGKFIVFGSGAAKCADIIGAELGGALKNIVAIAAGVCGGLGLGDNTRAALITRGMTEMARLGVCMGAKGYTFTGLTGIGDLIVTCMSDHSRNNRFGKKLGQGVSVKDALEQVGTVEGYYAAEMAHNLSIKYGIELPIITACYEVMYEGKDIKQALFDLMERPGRSEH